MRSWHGVTSLSILLLACTVAPAFQDQADAQPAAETPQATTVANPLIAADQLSLLVKPLTQGELVVEADAWLDLVQAKVAEISNAEVAIKQTNEAAAEAASEEEIKEDAKEEGDKQPAEEVDKAGDDKQDEPEAGKADAASATGEHKAKLQESLPALREERSALIDRLEIVLAELELKGGDVETYRLYASAVGGLNIDVTDTSTAWTSLVGWIKSVEGGQRWGWNLAKFASIMLGFWMLASIIGTVVEKAMGRMQQSSQLLTKFLKGFARKLVFAVGAMVALSALEVNIGPLLAAVGAMGLVIGLALQNTLSNFASGLLILAYRPFDVGHFIEAGGISGTVDSMNMLSTHVRTPDNKHVIIPNNKVWGDVIINATSTATRRVDMVFGIGYSDDVAKAQQILEQILADDERVLEDPAPAVMLSELADSSVNFVCRPWVKTSDYWSAKCDITRAAKERFDAEGISIPFPQRDIHIVHETNSEPA